MKKEFLKKKIKEQFALKYADIHYLMVEENYRLKNGKDNFAASKTISVPMFDMDITIEKTDADDGYQASGEENEVHNHYLFGVSFCKVLNGTHLNIANRRALIRTHYLKETITFTPTHIVFAMERFYLDMSNGDVFKRVVTSSPVADLRYDIKRGAFVDDKTIELVVKRRDALRNKEIFLSGCDYSYAYLDYIFTPTDKDILENNMRLLNMSESDIIKMVEALSNTSTNADTSVINQIISRIVNRKNEEK